MLEAEALVVSEPARGYRVSPYRWSTLQDLVDARIEIEKLCVAEAIRHGDLAWEGAIVSAFHRLTRVAERDAHQPDHLNHEWAAVHADFHRALVGGCPNLWLLRLHDMLYQQSERYRQLSRRWPSSTATSKPSTRASSMRSSTADIQGAQQRIAEHLATTAKMLLNSPHLMVSPAPAMRMS